MSDLTVHLENSDPGPCSSNNQMETADIEGNDEAVGQTFRSVMSGGVESAERVPINPAAVTPAMPAKRPISHSQGSNV